MNEKLLVPDRAGDGVPPSADSEAARRREVGRICGILFLVGALISVPSSLLLEPAPPGWVYAISAIALASGLAALAIPWERLPVEVFHAVAAVATVEVAVWIWGTERGGAFYSWYYTFVVIFVAYVFRSRPAIAAHLGWISLALLAPALYDPDSARDTFVRAMVAIPSLVVAATIVVFVRERLEAGQDAYRRLSRTDALTGIGNYRTLRERLDYEIARHDRTRRRFAVVLLDLAGLKRINDDHGHLEGDRVLRDVGQLLSEVVRAQDTVARQGGDEFSVLAPETSADEALVLTSRIEQALARIVVGDEPVNIAAGWAVYPDDGTAADALLHAADAELRRQKRERKAAEASKAPPPEVHLRVVGDE